MKTCISHFTKILKDANVKEGKYCRPTRLAGRLGWQGKAQAHCKRFFRSPTMGGYHNFWDLIWKITFTFVEKIGDDIFEADTAQNERTTFLPKR